MKIMVTSFKRSHACTAALNAPNLQLATTDPHLCWRLWTLMGKSGQSLVGSLLLSPGSWCIQSFVCALQESVSPVLCKFWQLYGGVDGNLLQEGLCHTHVCGTQSPCPRGRPLLTCTSTGDTQTLKGRSGSLSVVSPAVHKVLFETSECLWQVWDLILNPVLPLLLSCWGFSFALGHGLSLLVGSNILLLMVVQQ